ncbi:tetratricopeptide repeat protein [Streptomyces sp. NBC_00663]|uniref:tetratricopeptide repeat protein n=1 Tax=Streptomyces sp. NBC_00663 TaxID=2975801 RepID=UPI002E363F70|nr:tetratricopeptide repeat protein [Streptomyces sp. NBC_00663]
MWRRKGPNRTGLRRQLRTARVLFDTGDFAAAEVLLRRLLPDCEAELGAHHEETIGLLNLLGSTLYQQRKAAASAQIAREATDRAARAWGPDDPATLDCAHNLGGALAIQGDVSAAVTVLDDTWQRRARRLGAAHESTLTTANTLGATLFAAGLRRDGLTVLRNAFAQCMTLPAGHPVRVDIANNLRIAERNAGG